MTAPKCTFSSIFWKIIILYRYRVFGGGGDKSILHHARKLKKYHFSDIWLVLSVLTLT